MNVVIIDYGTGNLRSVLNALQRLGVEGRLTADPDEILRADKVLLPGVGNASEAVGKLRDRGLDAVIKTLRRPVLGICVGMQVMCRRSDEGGARGLGIFDTDVVQMQPTPGAKVPHMGWNGVSNLDSKLFKGIPEGEYFYFVHSFAPGLCTDTIATTRHGDLMFSSALKYENFYGTQFHPEKSGSAGEALLKNFLAL